MISLDLKDRTVCQVTSTARFHVTEKTAPLLHRCDALTAVNIFICTCMFMTPVHLHMGGGHGEKGDRVLECGGAGGFWPFTHTLTAPLGLR